MTFQRTGANARNLRQGFDVHRLVEPLAEPGERPHQITRQNAVGRSAARRVEGCAGPLHRRHSTRSRELSADFAQPGGSRMAPAACSGQTVGTTTREEGSMDEGLKGQVAGSAAEVYEEFFVPALFQQWAARGRGSGVQAGQGVLDVACGTGVLARDAARRVAPEGPLRGSTATRACSPWRAALPRRSNGGREGRGLPLPCRLRCRGQPVRPDVLRGPRRWPCGRCGGC